MIPRCAPPASAPVAIEKDCQSELQIQLYASHQWPQQAAALQPVGGRECARHRILTSATGAGQKRITDSPAQICRGSRGPEDKAGRRQDLNHVRRSREAGSGIRTYAGTRGRAHEQRDAPWEISPERRAFHRMRQRKLQPVDQASDCRNRLCFGLTHQASAPALITRCRPFGNRRTCRVVVADMRVMWIPLYGRRNLSLVSPAAGRPCFRP